MPTRTAKIVLLLLAVAVPLCAADPYVGTWKMDVPKSKYERGARPREQAGQFNPRLMTVSVKWFSPSEREVTYSKGANVVKTVRSRVSSDGESMSHTRRV